MVRGTIALWRRCRAPGEAVRMPPGQGPPQQTMRRALTLTDGAVEQASTPREVWRSYWAWRPAAAAYSPPLVPAAAECSFPIPSASVLRCSQPVWLALSRQRSRP